jgi:hypothetical protein
MTVCSGTCLVPQTYLNRGLLSAEIRGCVRWVLVTDVSAQLVDPTLRYGTDRLSRNVGN